MRGFRFHLLFWKETKSPDAPVPDDPGPDVKHRRHSFAGRISLGRRPKRQSATGSKTETTTSSEKLRLKHIVKHIPPLERRKSTADDRGPSSPARRLSISRSFRQKLAEPAITPPPTSPVLAVPALSKGASPSDREEKTVKMRKRRVVVPYSGDIANPYMTSTEFVVDARYKNLRKVGSGRFGIVMSALDTVSNERVAIKKVLSPFVSAHSTRHVLREVRLLRRLRHPHIVPLLDIDVPRSFDAWDAVYLVTPLLRTDLRTAMLRGRVGDLRVQKRILAQVLTALRHMHRANTMHRDLKSLNVLLDEKLNVQICDLGEARFYSKATGDGGAVVQEDDAPFGQPEFDTELTVGARTPLHSAPELFLNEAYDASVDIWGVGCIAAEMLRPQHGYLFDDGARRNPMHMVMQVIGYPSEAQMAHLEKRSSRWYMTLALKRNQESRLRELLEGVDGAVGEHAFDFVNRCLRFSPKERMTAQEALDHPFLAEVAQDVIDALDAKRGMDEDGFNFQLTEPPDNFSKKQLKDLVWKEVVAIHPEAVHMGIR